jgi:hypothetical protein
MLDTSTLEAILHKCLLIFWHAAEIDWTGFSKSETNIIDMSDIALLRGSKQCGQPHRKGAVNS